MLKLEKQKGKDIFESLDTQYAKYFGCKLNEMKPPLILAKKHGSRVIHHQGEVIRQKGDCNFETTKHRQIEFTPIPDIFFGKKRLLARS